MSCLTEVTLGMNTTVQSINYQWLFYCCAYDNNLNIQQIICYFEDYSMLFCMTLFFFFTSAWLLPIIKLWWKIILLEYSRSDSFNIYLQVKKDQNVDFWSKNWASFQEKPVRASKGLDLLCILTLWGCIKARPSLYPPQDARKGSLTYTSFH